MPTNIPVYAAEREAGLEKAILAGQSVTLTASVRLVDNFPLSKVMLERALAGRAVATNLCQPDELHYLKSVLATAGWGVCPTRKVPYGLNKNEDFFDPVETWLARHSPEDKPVNYEHNQADIIGHITANVVVDDAGNPVPDDAVVDDLPEKFHLVVGSVLYKVWDNPELQTRMAGILKEIADDKWSVSMECLFSNFDYLVADADGSYKVVARNKATAFLTKHLRAYDGDGKYEGRTVGRIIRNFTFSGKGLVRTPANPESVILTTASAEKTQPAKELGYCSPTELRAVAQNQESKKMAVETDAVQKQLDAAQAEIVALKAQLHDTGVKELTKAKEKAEAESAEAKKKLEEAAADNKAKAAEVDALKSVLKAAEEKVNKTDTELQAATAKLKTIEDARVKSERLTKVKAALKVKDDDAEAVKVSVQLAETLQDLSDEKFEVYLAAQAKFLAPAEKKPAEKVVAAVLDTAEPVKEAALATETDAGAEGVRLAIARHHGYKDESDSGK